MTIVLIILGLIILFALVPSKSDKSGNTEKRENRPIKSPPSIRMLNREGDVREDEWHTYIAGLPYRASKYDIGGFMGWVEPDYGNSHDRNAMGVYNSFGKLLGYIPARELLDYRVWCDAKPQPCVGFIFVEEGQMRGRVKILRPCNQEFLKEEFSRYLQWVENNYGIEYLPKNGPIHFNIE